MIRLACEADVPRLVEMGLRFRRETGYCQHLAESAGNMAQTATRLIESGGVLVSEREVWRRVDAERSKGTPQIVGMIGYIIYPHFLSGELVAGEVFWWVEPEFRGEGLKLLRETERRAQAQGARRMQMIAPNPKVAALYERLGYEFVESAYQRTL